MLAFEDVPRLRVVKGLGIPLDDGEVLAIVLRVATHTLFARAWVEVISSVQSLSIDKAGSDLCMTIETLEVRLACTQLMTSGAVGGAVQRLMRTGKRARRYLSCDGTSKKQNCATDDLQNQATFAWCVCHVGSTQCLLKLQSITVSLLGRKIQEV